MFCFVGQSSGDISDFSRIKKPDLLMTMLLPKHFFCCRIQCYTPNLPECNWGCHHFLLLQPLCPAAKDHQTLQQQRTTKESGPKCSVFYLCFTVTTWLLKQKKNSSLTEERFVWQDSSRRAKVFHYSPGDTIGPCVPGSDSISYVPPLTLPTNLTILETIITWSSLSDAFTDSCVTDYEVVSLLSESN